MIKYRTRFDNIEALEVERETAKQVFLPATNGTRARREDKVSDRSNWHDSWDAAHAFLVANAERDVESLRMRLEQAKGRVGQIRGMKPPTERRVMARDYGRSRKMKMNKGNMIGATERAKARVKGWADLADEVASDARKVERMKLHECKACFYSSRIGGAAMTTCPCMSCGSDEMYGSTATDVLCMSCATKHGLCRHCGGDLEMRTRRKDWPETPSANVTGLALEGD